MDIILASQSPYRKMQLQNFGLRFRAMQPNFDEETLKTKIKNPLLLAKTLAAKKAESLQEKYPDAVIIGGDQLVALGTHILGKPGTRQNAIQQLQKMSGRTHQLITALSVCHKGKTYTDVVVAKVKMRRLSRDEIIAYIYRDQPLDSAGSYKFEKSGFSLVEKMTVTDPSSLIGIPLISLMKILTRLKEPIPFVDRRNRV